MSDEPKFEGGETYIDRFLRPNQKGDPGVDRTPEARAAREAVRAKRKAAQKAALYEYGRRGTPR
jgi:hypothetical protein